MNNPIFPPSPLSEGSEFGTVQLPKQKDKARLRADRILNQIKEMEWENKDALQYLINIMEIPGMGIPDVMDEQKGGCAIWRKRMLGNLKTHAIKVCDECIRTKCLDKECCAFVYVSIDFDTSQCKCADQMMNLSRHVIIDIEKGIIKARGDSIEMCIAILSIFTGVGVCRVEPGKAKQMQADDKAIMLAKTSKEDYNKMIQSLMDNINGITFAV